KREGSEPRIDDLSSDYTHQVIDHAKAYAKGRIHTNGLENFWSLLKRAIKGTYVSVEPWHLFRYLDEESFRYNRWHGHDGDRFQTVLDSVTGRRVTYKALTGKALPRTRSDQTYDRPTRRRDTTKYNQE